MQKKTLSPLSILWICNVILFLTYVIGGPSLSFLKSSVLEYNNIPSDPFDGVVSPIAYVPDWSKTENMNKGRVYDSFGIADFIEIPEYNSEILSDTLQKTTDASILRYTYPVVYMGSYRGNHTEYDGSHPAVDIRAPIGTPVVSIANGVVVKIKNTESGDGKYVVIRHDNIDINGIKETLYSGYEHLSEIIAIEGKKIKRGEILGKVGMTGITTTPHLHFQIDKGASPSHIYWPYTFREAADLGLDFFGAINVGLGKENAIRYTVHPMDFIKNNRYLGSAPKEQAPLVETNSTPLVISHETVADTTIPDNTVIETVVPKIETVVPKIETVVPKIEPIETISTKTSEVSTGIISTTSDTPNPQVSEITTKNTIETPVFVADSQHIFSDIALDSPFYTATRYLYEKNVVHGYADGGFHPQDNISRSETILLYDRLFKENSFEAEIDLPFIDILPSDSELTQALIQAFKKNIVAKADYFRPNDPLTRAEAITLLVRTSGLSLSSTKTNIFKDVKTKNTHLVYINTFAEYVGLKGGNFEPNKKITRGELAKILYMFNQKKQKESD